MKNGYITTTPSPGNHGDISATPVLRRLSRMSRVLKSCAVFSETSYVINIHCYINLLGESSQLIVLLIYLTLPRTLDRQTATSTFEQMNTIQQRPHTLNKQYNSQQISISWGASFSWQTGLKVAENTTVPNDIVLATIRPLAIFSW